MVFKANTISKTLYKDRNSAGVVNDDVLTVRFVPRQFDLTLLFSFDFNCVVLEVTAITRMEI